MKKLISWSLFLALLLSILLAPGALALNYSGCQENEVTFETLEEARLSGPEAVQNLETNVGKTYVSHPALDGYPEGTTYIYRSAKMYGGRAAARLNTTMLVFSDKHFDEKALALDYLKELGVIDLIDEAIGSVILVTPANAEVGFDTADQKNYYALQTAICAQKATGTDAEGNAVSYSDAEYFGGYGYIYVVGIDGGATFLNNYVASTFDYVSRIAGLLLINGQMEAVRTVAALVPAYLVGASDAIIEKYQAVNDVDAYSVTKDADTFFNQEFPLQRVVVAKTQKSNADYIKDAYYGMFIKAMRVPVVKLGLYTASTPYQGGSFDQAPYSLCDRNAMFNGETSDGICMIRHTEERFADIKMVSGEYLQTWFEYLPEEVLNGTAPAGSIPLFLANHGGGDDPRLFVDEIGLLALAGKERFAVVAPDEQGIWSERVEGPTANGICCEVLPLIVKYMLETYPALDASRVYTLGYSMGGGATLKALNGDPALFAAGAVMAASSYVATPEQAAVFDTVDLPVMMMTSTYDFPLVYAFDTANNTIGSGFQKQIPLFQKYNEMPVTAAFDFEKYPIIGVETDEYVVTTLNNEYKNHTWYFKNAENVPMIAINMTENLEHALYPEYAKVFWRYAQHFTRDPETKAITYHP